jgi:hypothetical protein
MNMLLNNSVNTSAYSLISLKSNTSSVKSFEFKNLVSKHSEKLLANVIANRFLPFITVLIAVSFVS